MAASEAVQKLAKGSYYKTVLTIDDCFCSYIAVDNAVKGVDEERRRMSVEEFTVARKLRPLFLFREYAECYK